MSRPKVSPPNDLYSPGEFPWLAATLAAVAMLGCLLIGSGLQTASAPFPFVWLDVALVHFACAVPLALLAATAIHHLAGRNLCLLLAAVALAAGVVLSQLATPAVQSLMAQLQRALPALSLALAAALSVVAIRPTRLQVSAASLVLAVTGVAFVPPLYVHARLRNDRTRLAELLGQTRLAEAQSLAGNMARLDPALTFDKRSISEVAAEIDQQVEALATRALVPLPANADHEQLLARGQDLAILNFTQEALAVIAVAERSRESSVAANLRGTIHETRGEWTESLAAYEQARRLHERRDDEGDSASLVRAVTGIAFCQRKLGNKVAAAVAYEELLGLAPTADTNFLLAQFYDDTQQAALADQHARKAISLDPARYAHRGGQLIDKLRTTQFSCWAVGRSP